MFHIQLLSALSRDFYLYYRDLCVASPSGEAFLLQGFIRHGRLFVIESLEIGPSPSGKALGFGPSIRRFESCRSSHEEIENARRAVFLFLRWVGWRGEL